MKVMSSQKNNVSIETKCLRGVKKGGKNGSALDATKKGSYLEPLLHGVNDNEQCAG